MQTAPVAKQSLVDHFYPDTARSLEVRDGWEIYEQFVDCIVLRESKRFLEPMLPKLLDTIRSPNAADRKIDDEVWLAVEETFVGAKSWSDENGRDIRFHLDEWLDGDFAAIGWET